MGRLLMGGEGNLIAEDLVEEELRGLGARAVNDEAFHSRLLARLRGKAGQDRRHCVFLSSVGLPKCRHHQRILRALAVRHLALLWSLPIESHLAWDAKSADTTKAAREGTIGERSLLAFRGRPKHRAWRSPRLLFLRLYQAALSS